MLIAIDDKKLEALTHRIYVFMYAIGAYEDDVIYHEDGVPMKLSAEEILEILDARNDAPFDVTTGFCRLPKDLQSRILDAMEEQCKDILEDLGMDFDDVKLYVHPMPVELELALDEISPVKAVYTFRPSDLEIGDPLPVTLVCKYEHQGEMFEESINYLLRLDIANMMFTAIEEKPEGISDFDFFREVAPDAWDYIYNDVYCDINNTHLREWGSPKKIILSSFPMELYIEKEKF